MSKENFPDISAVIERAKSEGLYEQLIEQLKKDFETVGILLDVSSDITSFELKEVLGSVLNQLITTNFSAYLNLLYIVDVPEKLLKVLSKDKSEVFITQLSLVILKREWLKVWYKNNY